MLLKCERTLFVKNTCLLFLFIYLNKNVLKQSSQISENDTWLGFLVTKSNYQKFKQDLFNEFLV